MTIIAKQASENIVSDLKNSRFSLIDDETTDVSMKKCVVLVARCFDGVSSVQDTFLALLELIADAILIFIILTHEIPLKNIIGLATDGTNVMAGEIGGLKTLLNNETDLFYIKCTWHFLHLCSLSYYCRNIYSFFSHSPKRINELKEFQEYCSVKPHKILGINHTRWLSLEGVILRIIEQWDSLKLYFISNFYEVNGIHAAEFAKNMTNKMKCYLLFLSYILPIINNINKEFQSEISRLPYLYNSLKSKFLLISSKRFN